MATAVTSVAPGPTAAADGPGGRAPRRLGRRGVAAIFIVIASLIYIVPFLIQLATSFKTDPDAASHPLSLIPHPATLQSYRTIFGQNVAVDVPLFQWVFNSVLVTVCVTAGRVLLDSMAGYALARLHFRGRGVVFAGIVAVLAVPGVVLLIPKFLVIKQLGMFDAYSGMIIPLLADAAGIFIMRQFFESVPREVEEAARIDGAGVFRTYWSVVLPMAKPALITLTILSFQGSWNEFTHFLISTSSADKQTLTLGLARLVAGGLGGGTQYPLKLTIALVATIPVAVLFFCFQRYFIRGGNEGAVKG